MSLESFFLLVFLNVFPYSVRVLPESLLSVRSGIPALVLFRFTLKLKCILQHSPSVFIVYRFQVFK